MGPKPDFRPVAQIANDLDKLIPLGTIVYYNVPTSEYALAGIEVSRSSWRWLDADFLHSIFHGAAHPTVQALLFLIRARFVSATYKCAFLNVSGVVLPLWKVRIYAVPLDIDGSRYVRLWRASWLRSTVNLGAKFMSSWSSIRDHMDFSSSSWSNWPVNAAGQQLRCIPFLKQQSEGSLLKTTAQHSSLLSLESVVHEVYNSISSPDVSSYNSYEETTGVPDPETLISKLLWEHSSGSGSFPGLKSLLYPFQLRSVCKMYEKESFPKKAPVPNFVQYTSPVNTTYYFDTLNPGFYSQPELYTVSKGGILAENMGLGKTLICLALICFTKHEDSFVPDDILLSHVSTNSPIIRPSKRVKKLVEIAQDSIIQHSLPWRYYFDDLPRSVVQRLQHVPASFNVVTRESMANLGLRKRERLEGQTYRTLHLCNTTLVLVPQNLFHQWNDELSKHVHPEYLKKLFLSDRFKKTISKPGADYTDALPVDLRTLLSYDFILITTSMFSRLAADPDSLIMSVYWKRLIIDEGHSMSSRSSNLAQSCKNLYAERRWAVTGTPTSGLTNLHMEEDSQPIAEDSPKRKRRKYVVKNKFNVKDDLAKLGNLISNYFKIEPFHSQQNLWGTIIIKSLSSGNQQSAKRSLQNLLNSLMVRHQQAQVEKDLKLPDLRHEAVFLNPSFHNKLALNLFTAVLAVNAISSEREGSDYMFDSANRQQLRRLVNNLQISTFYWTGFEVEDVQTLVSIAENSIKKQTPDGNPKHTPQDLELLNRSLEAAKAALHNPRWKAAAMLHEMQFFVDGLPSSFIKHYGTGRIADLGVFGGPHMSAIQKFYYKNRFMHFEDSALLNERLESSSKDFWSDYWKDMDKKEKGKFSKQNGAHDLDQFAKTAENPRVSSDSSKNVKGSLTQSDTDGLRIIGSSGGETYGDYSDVKKAEILGTASAKLSYLASRLVSHQKSGVKSIVFFDYEDSAYYLTELLDILGVNYILYATFIGSEQRTNNLNGFAMHNASKRGGLTLIMDLKLASHGLTIISATQVYFMNPVWQRAIEAQAIKRAHRIGQTKEVHVETLVLRGTLEEEIYRRRHSDYKDETPMEEEKTSDSNNKYVIDDTGMQNFILRHTFLPIDHESHEHSEFAESGQIMDPSNHFDENSESLLSHNVELASGRDSQNKWHMRLFSKDNLEKLNASKKENANAEQLNSELVNGKADEVAIARKPSLKRKTVRF